MITTDYVNLVTDYTRPLFLKAMEGLTGSVASFGDTTPIPITEVLDGIGLSSAIQCFDSAIQNVTSLRKTLGLEFIRPYIPYFNELTNNEDSRLDALLALGELYMSGQGEGSAPARLDYCGDPIDTVNSLTSEQLSGRQQALLAYYDALPETHNAPPFSGCVIAQITNPDLHDTAGIDGGPVQTVIDPAQTPLPFTRIGYLEHRIDKGLANGNILKESVDYYARANASGKGFTWTLCSIGALVNNGPKTSTIVPWYSNIAIKYFAQAMGLAIDQILYGTQNLSSISELVTQAVANYAAAKAEPLPSVIYNLRCMSGSPFGGTPLLIVPGAEGVSKRIIDAGNAKKHELLSSLEYLSNYDLDFSEGLNATERYNAEINIQEEVLKSRSEQAQIEFQNAQNKYFFYKALAADLSSVFRLYIL